MMKFALFLVCALVAVQGSQARSTDVERDLNDIIETIKAVIEKIKQIISDVTAQIPEIIQNIKDKIKEIADKLPGIIADIKDKIQELIQNSEAGRKCVEAQRQEIDALVQLAQDGIKGCIDETASKTEALSEQLKDLITKASALRDDIVARTLKCVEDNKLNPVGLVNCLRDQVEPVKEELAALQKEVADTIALAKETIQEASAALTECSNKVQQEVAAKETQIINAIKECITSS